MIEIIFVRSTYASSYCCVGTATRKYRKFKELQPMALSLLTNSVQACEERSCRRTMASNDWTTRGRIDATTIQFWTGHNPIGRPIRPSTADCCACNPASPIDCRRAGTAETYSLGRHLEFPALCESLRSWRDDWSILRDPFQRSRLRRRRRLVARSNPPQLRVMPPPSPASIQ